MPASIYDPEVSEQYPLQMPWANRPLNLTPGTLPFKVYTSYAVCFEDVLPWLRWRWEVGGNEWRSENIFSFTYARNDNSVQVGNVIGPMGEAGSVGYSYPTALLVGSGALEPGLRVFSMCVAVRGGTFGETLIFEVEQSQGGALIETITVDKLDLAGVNSSEYANNGLDLVIERGFKPTVRYQGGALNATLNDCTCCLYGKLFLPNEYEP